MAGAINLTEVDFDQIKQNLVSYLKSTNKFTDYDFEGSNLSVILNLIAYQAQLNSYSTNMVANESFLSSASIRKNVVSNARQIGYTPRSTTSAVSLITFNIDLTSAGDIDEIYPGGLPQSLEIRPGNFFTVATPQGGFSFNIVDTQTAAVNDEGLAVFTNVPIIEGGYLTKSFIVDKTDPNQRFLLQNVGMDTSTLRVEVQEDPNKTDTITFVEANNLTEIDGTSQVYWLEEVEEGYYEITFGDGVFGKELVSGAKIDTAFVVSSGPVANGIRGANIFQFNGQIFDYFGGVVAVRPNVISVSTSEGGNEVEDIASIKFRAPKNYAAQNRCVTSADYELLIRKIYPAARDMYVYGGEELDIPEYGRVYVVIKPMTGEYVSNFVKKQIKDALMDYRVASLDIVFQDPDTLYIECDTTVYYDEQKTTKDSSAITATVRSSLSDFAESSIVSRFGGSVRYSRIIGAIDDSDDSITRNMTSLRMRKNIAIAQDTLASYEVCFENPIINIGNTASVYSTGFSFTGDSTIYYVEDDPTARGNIRLFRFDSLNNKIIENKTFGTVDYVTGEVMLGEKEPFSVGSTVLPNSIIELRSYPQDLGQDIKARRSVYLQFDVAKSDIGSVVDTGTTGS